MRSRGVGAMVGGGAALLLLAVSCGPPADLPADIEEQIAAVPGVQEVREVGSEIPGHRCFYIAFEQPIDHAHPEGQRFTQRLTLHHRDEGSPLVLVTAGYQLFLPEQALTEPAALLGANQLHVEHRYFDLSRPEPADWTLLDIEQAAADHHSIARAFRPLYTGKWISTGKSKGGTAAIVHRRFHPGDVDGTVAYVAPLTLGLDDARYVDFLAHVGTAACRKRIEDFQREVLLRRDAMIQRMAGQAAANGLGYEVMGVVPSFESAVRTFAFSFWQSRDEASCASIPESAASEDEVWSFFDGVKRTLLSTDPFVIGMEPYRWQARTELGTPGIDTSGLDDLLTVDFDAIDDLPSIAMDPVFDPAPAEDVASWFAESGDRILLIHGENDPWTAGALAPGAGAESYRLVVPGGDHSSNIAALPESDRRLALDALEVWTGVSPDPPDP
jgi:hypothetical protein